MYPQSFWSSGQNTSLIHSFRRRASEGRKTGASIWRISFSVNSNRRYVDLLEGFAAAAVGGGSAHCYSYSNSRRRRRCSYLKIFLRLLPTCFLLSLVLLVSLIKVAWEDRVMEVLAAFILFFVRNLRVQQMVECSLEEASGWRHCEECNVIYLTMAFLASDALISELSFAVIFLGTDIDHRLQMQSSSDHKGCVNTIAGNSGGSLLMSVSDDMRNVLSATFLCGNEQHCETMGSDTGIHQEPVSQDSFLTMRVAQPLILCR
nr:WD and tetratricopeptide repeats protein 1-like isoform X1 [Ipomoea batatas]